jgi:hypothetical protein
MPVGPGALDVDDAAAVVGRVADDDEATPVAGLTLAAGRDEVKTIGAAAVPTALILAPRMIMSEEPSTL